MSRNVEVSTTGRQKEKNAHGCQLWSQGAHVHIPVAPPSVWHSVDCGTSLPACIYLQRRGNHSTYFTGWGLDRVISIRCSEKCLVCKQHMQLKLLINTAPTATRHVPSLGVGGISKLLPYSTHTAIKRRSIYFSDAAEPRKENRTWPASQTSRPTVTAQSNGSFLHTLHHINVTKYNILFLLQLRAEDTEPHILKQGNLDQGWLQANHLPEPSWLGRAFLDGPVWLSAHGHPAMSCGFSVPKEVVFSEQRHLGEKQIC